jgi:hypothetical protein
MQTTRAFTLVQYERGLAGTTGHGPLSLANQQGTPNPLVRVQTNTTTNNHVSLAPLLTQYAMNAVLM